MLALDENGALVGKNSIKQQTEQALLKTHLIKIDQEFEI